MAEAIFSHLVAEAGLSEHFEIQSAGTGGWHAGERPHRGTQMTLMEHHVPPIPHKVAQQVRPKELTFFDYIIAMDQDNLEVLQYPEGKTHLLLEFAPEGYPLEVPDPYYTGDFEDTYRLVDIGCRGLLRHIREVEGV
jgi:protein-tyrosine phosphatase